MTPRKKKPAALPPVKHRGYMLRTCTADMTAHGGFKWPRRGFVEAPDWSPKAECGQGLHGLAGGVGTIDLMSTAEDAVWMVVCYDVRQAVNLDGKIKVPRGWVQFAGARDKAVALMVALGCTECAFGTATAGYAGTATAGYAGTATAGYAGTATAGVRGTATAGDAGTATAGDAGTATAGDAGTATAGVRGTATAGDAGTATAGVRGTATAGVRGTATAGVRGTATAGYAGTATAGVRGTATAGVRGTATAGYAGTATAGDAGTATAGYAGTATAGYAGTLILRWYDSKAERYRVSIGYVGEDGIEAGKRYRCEAGKLVAVDGSAA